MSEGLMRILSRRAMHLRMVSSRSVKEKECGLAAQYAPRVQYGPKAQYGPEAQNGPRAQYGPKAQ